MFRVFCRLISKKVRIPSGNVRQGLGILVPQKEFLDPKDFSRLSQDYLFKVKTCLKDIQESNTASTLEITHSSIKFSSGAFTLVVERSFSDQSLQVLVGDGIVHSYFYDTPSERWLCTADGHLLEELLCREVTRKCEGYFNF